MGDIGKNPKEYQFEPLPETSNPDREYAPAPEPVEEPAAPAVEPEKVPA